jgi:glycosyltransferase involved in cell wall biosynthesis
VILKAAVVVPNRDGRRWLPGLLDALRAQTRAAERIVVVDDGSRDDSVAWLREHAPDAIVIARPSSGGFAAAVNTGMDACADCDAVALVNTDVVLDPDWLARTTAVLEAVPEAGSVACKMVGMDDPGLIDDAGDTLRRDGVCEQRGRGSGAPVGYWVARNSLLLTARWFPAEWVPYVAYRHASWLVDAARRGRAPLRDHVRGLRDGARALPGTVRARRGVGGTQRAAMERAVPPRPWRGAAAGGHPGASE